jgi:hypothetical protein
MLASRFIDVIFDSMSVLDVGVFID